MNTQKQIKAAVLEILALADGPAELTDIARLPRFRGVNFGKLMKACEALAADRQLVETEHELGGACYALAN